MTLRMRKDSIIGKPRKENGQLYLITPKVYSKPHFINNYIFKLWNELDGKDINTLMREYLNRFPKVNCEKIKKDIMDSLIYLNNLKMIDITGEDIEVMHNMIEKGTSLVNECDFREINEFILNTFDSGNGCIINFKYENMKDLNIVKDSYSIQAMRINQIHGKELYFKNCDENKRIKGLIGIILTNNVKTCYINTIILPNQSDEKIKDLINEFINYLKRYDFQHFKIKTSKVEFLKLFLEIGFQLEAELKDELENQKSVKVMRRDEYDS